MTQQQEFIKQLPPIIDKEFFKFSFDPIEANFLATILQDCFYQLFNVGKDLKHKHLKQGVLVEAETRGRNIQKKLSGEVNDIASISKSPNKVEFPLVFTNQEEGKDDGYASQDESLTWIEKLVEASGFLESMYMSILDKTEEMVGDQKGSQERNNIRLEAEGIRMKTFELGKTIADRENLLNQSASDRVACILDDLQRTISDTFDELKTSGTFECLKQKNKLELKKLDKASVMVEEEILYFNKCRNLLEDIFKEKLHGTDLMKVKEEQVAHLKDYLKEQKVLKAVEINYIKKFTEAKLQQAKKKNHFYAEKVREKDLVAKQELDNNKSCNVLMEKYLKRDLSIMETKFAELTQKYEELLEETTSELQQLEEKKLREMEWHGVLKKRIIEYQQVIDDEERMQKIKDDEENLKKLQNLKAIKIQAWWRGMMVRKCIGAFKKKKAKKEKKGKKGKK